MDSILINTIKLARQEAAKQGLPVTAARPHQLVLLSKLKNGKDTFVFSAAAADQQAIARDFALGLLDKDGFFMSRAALLLLRVPIIGGKEHFTAAAPVAWADPRVFTGAAADANSLSQAQQLEPIYGGRLGLTTNNDVRLEDYYTRNFRTIHTTQRGVATVNEQHGCEFVEFGTVFSMNGFEKNNFQLNILSEETTQIEGDADHQNYAMLIADGAIVKNMTTAILTK